MIKYRKQAEKFILSQGKQQATRIMLAVERLPAGDVKPYKGRQGSPKKFRLRIGGYRIIFCVVDNVIHVLEVDNRGDIY